MFFSVFNFFFKYHFSENFVCSHKKCHRHMQFFSGYLNYRSAPVIVAPAIENRVVGMQIFFNHFFLFFALATFYIISRDPGHKLTLRHCVSLCTFCVGVHIIRELCCRNNFIPC